MDVAVTLVFAVLAGAGTALSPCVLPVLPVALAAGATGGRRRPLGVAVGLAGTFAAAAVLLTRALDALGLPGDLARGVADRGAGGVRPELLVPPLGAAVEARLSRLVRRGPPRPRGRLPLRARPRRLARARVRAVRRPDPGRGGRPGRRRVGGARADRLRLRRGGRGRAVRGDGRAGGALVRALVTAHRAPAAGARGADARRRAAARRGRWTATSSPRSPTTSPRRWSTPPAGSRRRRRSTGRWPACAAPGAPTCRPGDLPDAGPAPEFTGTGRWLNTPGGRPLTLAALRGRVVLIDFWTYTCINCLRTLSNLRAWDARYRAAGLTVVGVHTPEFAFERSAANVADAVRGNDLRYPVVQDNAYGTWHAWRTSTGRPSTSSTPAGACATGTSARAGRRRRRRRSARCSPRRAARRGTRSRRIARSSGPRPASPRPRPTWAGARAQLRQSRPAAARRPELRHRPAAARPGRVRLPGRVGARARARRRAAGAPPSTADVGARRVFLVLSSPGRPRRARVLVDGRPVPDALAGPDVRDGVAVIRAPAALPPARLRAGGAPPDRDRARARPGGLRLHLRLSAAAGFYAAAVDTIDELLANNRAFAAALPDDAPRRPAAPAPGRRDVHGLAPERVRRARAPRRRGAHPAQRRRGDHRRRDPLARGLPAPPGHARGDAHPPHGLRHAGADRRRLPRRAPGGHAASRRRSRSSRSPTSTPTCASPILRVRRSPFLLHHDTVRGFVYDVDTHKLREVQV